MAIFVCLTVRFFGEPHHPGWLDAHIIREPDIDGGSGAAAPEDRR